jgi:hypothetical protein
MEVYRTISEMKKNNKQLNNMTQKELAILEKKIRRNRKILLVMIIILIIIFKLTIGYLRINVYTFHNGYQISINDKYLSYDINEEFRGPIIPFFIEFYNYWDSSVIVNTSNAIDKSNSYILSIKEYECYSLSYRQNISCDTDKDILGEKSNYIIKNLSDNNYQMYIKNSKEEIVYKGKLIKNITKYLKKGETYSIKIIDKERNVKNTIDIDVGIGK